MLQTEIPLRDLDIIFTPSIEAWLEKTFKTKINISRLPNSLKANQNTFLDVLIKAIDDNNLEILKLLYSHNLFEAESFMHVSSYVAHPNCKTAYQWFLDHGFKPCSEHIVNVLLICRGTREDIEYLDWLKAKGCPLKSYLYRYVLSKEGNEQIMSWFQRNLCPWDDQELGYARKKQNHQFIKWCHENQHLRREIGKD